MDYRLKIYCQIDGVDYYDWTVCFQGSSYYSSGFLEKGKNLVVLGADIFNQIKEESCSFLDDKYIPKNGSSIHLVSGCPVGIADIRKNYTIKRKPDDGDCNVFSPYNGYRGILWNTAYAIVPSEKTIVLSNKDKYSNALDIYQSLQHFFPDKWKIKDPCPVLPGADVYKKDLALFYTVPQEEWLMLLKGELKKPCVSYKKLEFKTDNEINTDILYLVYKTGIQRYGAETKKAFHIQLCALNEHNWRDYTGTVSMLFSNMLRPEDSKLCCSDLGSPSKLPKAVKEMVAHCTHTALPFKSQKDMEMAQKLIRLVVDIPEDRQFSTIEELATKFNEKKIYMHCFYRTFENIVKFRPKVFKENES